MAPAAPVFTVGRSLLYWAAGGGGSAFVAVTATIGLPALVLFLFLPMGTGSTVVAVSGTSSGKLPTEGLGLTRRLLCCDLPPATLCPTGLFRRVLSATSFWKSHLTIASFTTCSGMDSPTTSRMSSRTSASLCASSGPRSSHRFELELELVSESDLCRILSGSSSAPPATKYPILGVWPPPSASAHHP